MNNKFNGMGNFTWFIGVIEDIADPLAVGRCRIRVQGWHTDNKTLLPTKDLPWAMPMLSINNSKTWHSPLIGDWIIGFFSDGENAQMPIMMGILPYISQG